MSSQITRTETSHISEHYVCQRSAHKGTHMAPRACKHLGCTGITTSGSSCSNHKTPRSKDTRTRTGRYTGEYPKNRALLLASNPACVRCGWKADTADHILPIDSGGTHELSNLQPMCKRCNSQLGNHHRWNKNKPYPR